MLLRSSSTPILKSWIPQSKDPPPESDAILYLSRTKSMSIKTSSQSLSSHNEPIKKSKKKKSVSRAVSSFGGHDFSFPKKTPPRTDDRLRPVGECREQVLGSDRLLLSSGLAMGTVVSEEGREGCGVAGSDRVWSCPEVGGGAAGGGGKICGNGGGARGSDGGDGSGFYESNNGSDSSTDAYYEKMIDANPGNALLLGNYAKFLKEVRGDLSKAEEYCERAISNNTSDGDVLSLYAEILWQYRKDCGRAQSYFDRAVKTAPDDCFVLASYARFLWDAEEEDEEDSKNHNENMNTSPSPSPSGPNFFNGSPYQSPLTAALLI